MKCPKCSSSRDVCGSKIKGLLHCKKCNLDFSETGAAHIPPPVDYMEEARKEMHSIKNKERLYWIGIISIPVGIIILTWIILDGISSKKPSTEACQDNSMAYVMSQKAVRKHLNFPDSAEFPSRYVASEYIGACQHRVVGTFTAKNAFGMPMPYRYSVTMTKTDRMMWNADEMNIVPD